MFHVSDENDIEAGEHVTTLVLQLTDTTVRAVGFEVSRKLTVAVVPVSLTDN